MITFFALDLLNRSTTPNLPRASAGPSLLNTILRVTFILIGSLALMMFVIAGFRYTISGGDPTKIADTKRAMIYTAVGVIVSASAYIIVNAVLGHVGQGQ